MPLSAAKLSGVLIYLIFSHLDAIMCLTNYRPEVFPIWTPSTLNRPEKFENGCFTRQSRNAKPEFQNFSCLKSVFEKLHFRDGLVWTVGLPVEIKPHFPANSSGAERTRQLASPAKSILLLPWKQKNQIRV